MLSGWTQGDLAPAIGDLAPATGDIASALGDIARELETGQSRPNPYKYPIFQLILPHYSVSLISPFFFQLHYLVGRF